MTRASSPPFGYANAVLVVPSSARSRRSTARFRDASPPRPVGAGADGWRCGLAADPRANHPAGLIPRHHQIAGVGLGRAQRGCERGDYVLPTVSVDALHRDAQLLVERASVPVTVKRPHSRAGRARPVDVLFGELFRSSLSMESVPVDSGRGYGAFRHVGGIMSCQKRELAVPVPHDSKPVSSANERLVCDPTGGSPASGLHGTHHAAQMFSGRARRVPINRPAACEPASGGRGARSPANRASHLSTRTTRKCPTPSPRMAVGGAAKWPRPGACFVHVRHTFGVTGEVGTNTHDLTRDSGARTGSSASITRDDQAQGDHRPG